MAQSVNRVTFHSRFNRHFDKRVKPYPKLLKKFNQRYQLFLLDRNTPLIRDHSLTGDLSDFRSFWVTGDIRVIYQLRNGGGVKFFDIGTHDQVYGS